MLVKCFQIKMVLHESDTRDFEVNLILCGRGGVAVSALDCRSGRSVVRGPVPAIVLFPQTRNFTRLCLSFVSHPGRVAILSDALFYRKRDKFRPCGPPWPP